jgi:hypothetical protein
VPYGLKAGCRLSADSLRRRVRILQLGVRRLERRQLAHERVELGVGDLGCVVQVVLNFVMSNQLSELRDTFGGKLGNGGTR